MKKDGYVFKTRSEYPEMMNLVQEIRQLGFPFARVWKRAGLADVLASLLFVVYLGLFIWGNSKEFQGISAFWFNSNWTTDDATQQAFPFLRALYPGLFDNDYVARMMMNYVPPLHYWVGYFITVFTRNPVMTGHWLMLIQLLLTLAFIYGAVRQLAGNPAALFAMTWFLHTRRVVQRMTCGLPRGWAAPVIAAYFFFIVKDNHKGVLAAIFIGSLIHPPSTLVISAAYGLYLLWRVALNRTRAQYLRPFLIYAALCPVLFVVTLWSASKPVEFGSMVTYEQALKKPEFSSIVPKGRFAFVPFKSVKTEVSANAFHAFANTRAFPFFKSLWRKPLYPVLALAAGILIIAALRKRTAIPASLWTYALAAACAYAAARIFAFRLFVPDRYLQFPFAIFFVIAFSAGVWRTFASRGLEAASSTEGSAQQPASWKQQLQGVVVLALLGLFIYSGSGTGLYRTANFNYPRFTRGGVFEWVKNNTPLHALIAGEPVFIDPAQLFGERAALITVETAHPFYDRYWNEALRRLELSLQAHYATSLEDLVRLLEPEKVDYFIFDRRKFKPLDRTKFRYFNPLHLLVNEIAVRPVDTYAYSKLSAIDSADAKKIMPYRDARAVVVDVHALKEYLQAGKGSLEKGSD